MTKSRSGNGSGHKEGSLDFSSLGSTYIETSFRRQCGCATSRKCIIRRTKVPHLSPSTVPRQFRGAAKSRLAAFPRCALYDVPVKLLQLLCSLHGMGFTGSQHPDSAFCRQGQGRGSRKGSFRGSVTTPTEPLLARQRCVHSILYKVCFQPEAGRQRREKAVVAV